jgi:hypothetical protein
MTVKQNDSRLVTLMFAQVLLVKNRPKDEFLSYEPVTEDRIEDEVDEGGDVISSVNQDGRHIVIAKFTIASPANPFLSTLLARDLATPGGAGFAPLEIIDGNGTTMFIEPFARIKGHPKRTFSQKMGDKVLEWKFTCHNPTRFDGGL